MGTYVVVTKLTPAGRKSLHANPDRLAEVNRRVERMGAKIRHQYATLGQHDEEAILSALGVEPAYLGVVASRKRFAQLRETLLARGLPEDALDSVKNPAGLDIGASLPEEVALSILAEIVQLRRAAVEARPAEPAAVPLSEIDPVCGMTVAVASARHRTEHSGRSYYFCNPRCREKFIADKLGVGVGTVRRAFGPPEEPDTSEADPSRPDAPAACQNSAKTY